MVQLSPSNYCVTTRCLVVVATAALDVVTSVARYTQWYDYLHNFQVKP